MTLNDKAQGRPMRNISKSKYLVGLQCPVWFWREMNDPSFAPQHDAATLARFDWGHVVGDLAKGLFPGGVDLPTEDFGENIQITGDLVKERRTLFEAGFSADGLYCRSDVLVPLDDGSFELIEVKGTTRANEIHVWDLAFQWHVLTLCGLDISRAAVLHLDNGYVRRGDLDVEALFAKTDVTDEVRADVARVPAEVARLRKLQAMDGCPEVVAFGQCESHYECPVHSLIELPDGHVSELSRGVKKVESLVAAGVESLVDIPDDFDLTDKQWIQVTAARDGRPHLEQERIGEFLEQLEYPLWHLDFETMQLAVPGFDESRPYQQIPFQYSIHEERADGAVVHHEFLAVGAGDPRAALMESMRSHLGDTGSVLVYYQGFENARLKEMARDLPQHADWIQGVLDRVVDLYEPFGKYWYYDPAQKGSASIKKVLPALTDMSYDGMEIAEGTAAAGAFLELRHAGETLDDYDDEATGTRRALLEYCEQDTRAMVEVLGRLRGMIGG